MNFILFLFEPTNMKLKNVGGSIFIYIFILPKKWFFPQNGKKCAFLGQKCNFYEKINHLTKLCPQHFVKNDK